MSEQLLQMQEVLKRSLLKIKQLEADLAAAQAAPKAKDKEPIAIVGLGCRFPGGVNKIESLWQLLMDKKDVSKPIPKDRWDNEAIYDPDPLRPGHTHARTAAFLEEDVKAFDAGFFGIVPREAKSIDPLQRMILEVVYEALEEAGIAADSLKGTNTAVFIAIGNSDYIQARFRSGNLETMDVYDATGIPFATAAGRVSYLYDLQGPNFALDAACASSIVGLHLACESLQKGESDTAIVASANLLLTPELFVGLSKLGSLSAEGKCKAFSDDADGYVRGEGCGVAILRRKADALANKDNIHAIILGSAVKHDGLSNGFTAPNPKAQVDTIHLAMKEAAIQPDDVLFVEAHGIGNKFTDAMEIQAIANGYKGRKTPVYVGSLKPNIGHLEACIGMAMLFKVIGTLKNKTIAPNIYFEKPNTDIPWDSIPVKVPVEPLSIHADGKPLRVAINLSGYSGTNVHMIFEEAPSVSVEKWDNHSSQLFTLSAKSPEALQALAGKYLEEALLWDNQPAEAIAWTLQKGRSHFEYKWSCVAHDVEAFRNALQNFVSGAPDKQSVISNPEKDYGKDIAFLFTGQGAQYPGMCKELYDLEPVFRSAVDECVGILKPIMHADLQDIIFGEGEQVHQTQFTQPALFVVEYALAKLWMSRGIQPSAVIGHSIGEFVALVIADAISLNDALQLVAERGRLMGSLPEHAGSMAAVMAAAQDVADVISQLNVDIAAINAPGMTTISGDKQAVATAIQLLKDKGIKSLPLTVSHAFHSSMMDSVLGDFEAAAARVAINEPSMPVISNVTGQPLTATDLTPSYFSRHLRGTVRFYEGLKHLVEDLGIRIFAECGPSPTLSSFGEKSFLQEEMLWLSSAKKGSHDHQQLLKAVQQLYTAGISLQWEGLHQGRTLPRIELPRYAWQKQVYWENPVRGIGVTATAQKTATTASEEKPKVSVKVSKENLMAIMQLEGCDTLGLHPGQKLDPAKSLRDQGFDSMMSGEFLSRMEKYFNTQLEMSLIHTHGTLNDLQRHFIDEYMGGGEIGESAVTMNDIVFGSDLGVGHAPEADWHTIKETDPLWLKVFKKIDSKISI